MQPMAAKNVRATAATSKSSSTNSTCSAVGTAGSAFAASRPLAATPPASGKYRLSVVPTPNVLSTVMAPCDCLTKPYTVLKPKPVPRPNALVVKNGSNARSFTTSSMPLPLSMTRTVT